MVSVRTGGDPESYMEAPSLGMGGEADGPSLLATVLDIIGIHRQVAKGPKGKKASGGTSEESSPKVASQVQATPATPGPPLLPALDAAESAFQPMVPMTSDWGKRFLDSVKPIKTYDPNTLM